MICSLYLLSCRSSEDLSIENTISTKEVVSQKELNKTQETDINKNTISADKSNTKKDPPVKDKQDWKFDPQNS